MPGGFQHWVREFLNTPINNMRVLPHINKSFCGFL